MFVNTFNGTVEKELWFPSVLRLLLVVLLVWYWQDYAFTCLSFASPSFKPMVIEPFLPFPKVRRKPVYCCCCLIFMELGNSSAVEFTFALGRWSAGHRSAEEEMVILWIAKVARTGCSAITTTVIHAFAWAL